MAIEAAVNIEVEEMDVAAVVVMAMKMVGLHVFIAMRRGIHYVLVPSMRRLENVPCAITSGRRGI